MADAIRAAVQRGRPRDLELTSRRRAEILDAAALIFAREGYRAADVQRIADEVKLSKGAIYRYFPSKRELFLACVERAMTQLNERLNAAAAAVADPLERIRRAVFEYLEFFARRPEVVELIVQERAELKRPPETTYFSHRRANLLTWQKIWSELMGQGRAREMPVERITDVIGNALYGAILTNYFTRRQVKSRRQAADILDIVLNGVLAPQCERALDRKAES
jgi:AcrR family transcriptional regulator